MQKIKIVSNPYIDKISFYVPEMDNWKEIDYTNKEEENNRLLNAKIVNGFFPFIVKDIVDIIVEDYGDDTDIEFEGTSEAYSNLKEICKSYPNINLTQSKKYLKNASDVLEDIIKMYAESKTLIEKSILNKETVNVDTKKFLEASNDVIPLCVIGNYSSGKSTFINALIGSDILPSGDDPVTANVYKIIKSDYNSIAKISFKLNNKLVEIIFDGNNFNIKNSLQDNTLIYQIENELDQLKNEPFNKKLNKVINILNNNNKDVLNLEISVPFSNGLLETSQSKFVIFDTPGSDSATYEQHLKVLKEELESLSNGLIMFIVDRLDSKGNEKLFSILKNIKELDSRFTMIVVNKADIADLPDRGSFTQNEINKKLDLSLPRNLYSNGIYFVSSILGLGAKNNGDFVSSHNAKLFELNKDIYSNPENKYYKSLYNYDIMPTQLKARMLNDASGCENKIFANSGLYAVEHEILTFANQYSSYNKCRQSQVFLEKIIQVTKNEIDQRKERISKYRQMLIDVMESEKRNLCKKLDDKRLEYKTYYDEEYSKEVGSYREITKNEYVYNSSVMAKKENDIKEKYLKESDMQGKKASNKKSKDTAINSIKGSFNELKTTRNLKNSTELAKNVVAGLKTVITNKYSEIKTINDINQKTSKELKDDIVKEFSESIEECKNKLYKKSRLFYDSKANDVRNSFLKITNVTDALTSEQKAILENVILSYKNIDFNINPDDIFVDKELKFKVFIFTFNKYDSTKLSNVFNENINEGVDKLYQSISNSHKNSFIIWIFKLVDLLKENIIKFNPVLLAKAEEINGEEEKLNALEKDKEKLINYLNELNKLIDWHIDL